MANIIEFTHKISKRTSRMTIKISPKGEVIVVTPRFVPKWTVQLFVNSQQQWITTHLAKMPSQRSANEIPQDLQLFGKSYSFKIEYSNKLPTGIRIERTTVILNPLDPSITTWTAQHTAQLNRFLKQTARTYIETRTHQLAEKMSIQYKTIRYKEQVSRWGSCSSDGNLNFNWRLVHAPPTIIDYVIIHELAHRTHMNHSAKFWNLVATYDPEHAVHRGWLKRHGAKLFS